MDYNNEDWIFLMQDIRGYVHIHGAEQLLHDIDNLFPDIYTLIVDAVRKKEIKEFNDKKKAALLTPKNAD